MIIIMIIFQCQYLFLTFLLHLEIYTLIKSTRDVHAMLEKKKKNGNDGSYSRNESVEGALAAR